VAACAKHFPGLGAVPKDPHKQLPTLPLEWDAMRAIHLAPFVEAIRAGVATIMSSHVCYPRLDPTGVPATFSSGLMRTLLREEMGFPGLILTDDLEMGALGELCTIGEAAVRAVEAGHELLLVCATPASQRAVFEALCAAYRSRRLAASELEHTVERITRLRDQSSKQS
jgi:beta-N-acetylhexosaminidase